jgi:hypothetical protein
LEFGRNCGIAGLILRQNGFRFWALGNFELMKARALANFGCWLLIFPLPAAAILYAVLVWHSWGVPPRYGSYYDLNGYTDPIAAMLSYLTPVSILGVVGLAVLRRFNSATKAPAIAAATIAGFFTLALLSFGLWLQHKCNAHFDLSYWAWWL